MEREGGGREKVKENGKIFFFMAHHCLFSL